MHVTVLLLKSAPGGVPRYHPLKHFGGQKALRTLQHRDRIKRNWTRRNGWRLIVICYRIKNIEAYLHKRLNPLRAKAA
jgi:hypothetical protein